MVSWPPGGVQRSSSVPGCRLGRYRTTSGWDPAASETAADTDEVVKPEGRADGHQGGYKGGRNVDRAQGGQQQECGCPSERFPSEDRCASRVFRRAVFPQNGEALNQQSQ